MSPDVAWWGEVAGWAALVWFAGVGTLYITARIGRRRLVAVEHQIVDATPQTATSRVEARESEAHALAYLVLLVGRQDRLTRDPKGQPESVATHSLMLALTANLLYGDDPSVDLARLLLFAAVHDLPEAFDGDTPTLVELDAEQQRAKDLKEAMAIGIIGSKAPHVAALIAAYERQDTREARIIKVLDKALPRLLAVLDGGASIQAQGLDLEWLDARLQSQSAELRRRIDEEVAHAFGDAALARLIARWGEDPVGRWADLP